jgi:RNA polymerase sigma-70 factor, ECF subfamily
VRAKTKIRDAEIPFRVPDPPELSERLPFVLDAIYAAYTTGWDSLPDAASTHRALHRKPLCSGAFSFSSCPVNRKPWVC